MKIYDTGLSAMHDAKAVIDTDLQRFVSQWRRSYDEGSIDAIDAYCQIMLNGGKRLRGVLAMQSYYAHGGRDESVALGAARVLELIQAYLLVIDDIADRSDTRRGGPSAHRLIEATAHKGNMRGDIAHYSQAQAMNAAQSGAHKASLELLQLRVSDSAIRSAMTSLHKNVEITAMGQMNDIFNESTNVLLDEAAIERVLTQKSAYYTFMNPLELGACLAGHDALDPSLSAYAVNIGCAFQIADDLIGTFGREVESGKGVNDDIREGKMTILAQQAMARADEANRATLRTILGTVDATEEQCDEVRVIMKMTGAYEYAATRRDWYATKARESLNASTVADKAFVAFLDQLIDYVTLRTS